MLIEAFIARIKEAIENSPPSQGTIAEHCGVSRQSVTNWKTSGQISPGNLRKLSEVTGYRYVWLKTGSEPKRFLDKERNTAEFLVEQRSGIAESGGPYDGLSNEVRELIESIRYAHANRKLTAPSLKALTEFFNSIVDSNHS